MKKFFILLPIFVIIMFSSCEKPVTTTVTTTTTKATMTEPGTNGFLISQRIVVHGNTVWGFSRESYGTGLQWRDIVAQNQFLQQPGRVYYNNDKKMWIVKIYPGEVVKIGGEIIVPSCVFEETTTTIEKTSSPEPIIPWWGWLTIVGVIALIIWLFRSNNNASSTATANATSTAAIEVDMVDGLCFDHSVRLATVNNNHALLMRREDKMDNMINLIGRASDKELLSHFHFNLNPDNFVGSVDYKNGIATKEEVKKVDQKPQKVEKK